MPGTKTISLLLTSLLLSGCAGIAKGVTESAVVVEVLHIGNWLRFKRQARSSLASSHLIPKRYRRPHGAGCSPGQDR